jgi:hypothetical protein
MTSKKELGSYKVEDIERTRIAAESIRFASGITDPHVEESVRESAEHLGLRRQEFIESLERLAVERTISE